MFKITYKYNNHTNDRLHPKEHPIQPKKKENIVLNFNEVYNRIVLGKMVHRSWLSILTNDNGLKIMFCII